MNKNLFLLVFFFFVATKSNAQIVETAKVVVDSVATDSIPVVIPKNTIQNPKALANFFLKLDNLQKSKSGKINIVHIGDSHIQADFMTGVVRKKMQNVFGNGGRGLVFPYNLAKTNGTYDVKFSSNASWSSYRMVSPVNGSAIGLSGVALTTKNTDYAVEINVKDAENQFNTFKIVTPENKNIFEIATEKCSTTSQIRIPQKITHKIKKGESISEIAATYGVNVNDIKKVNFLKTNKVRAGRVLKIPKESFRIKTIDHTEFVALPMLFNKDFHFYTCDTPLDKIYLLPKKEREDYSLNGIILENNNAGLLYHNIGVNGAKLSDYNKYPIFFEQLKALQPDLIVVALGTNESFSQMKAEDYMAQLDLFLQNVKMTNPNAEILVSTPPPSLFQRRSPNIFVADYAQKITNIAPESNYAVWDLYGQLGGFYGVNQNFKQGLMANDRVHYSKKGYEKQGNLLFDAIFKSFEIYQNQKK